MKDSVAEIYKDGTYAAHNPECGEENDGPAGGDFNGTINVLRVQRIPHQPADKGDR